jgi:hypothetical protein
VPNLVTAALGMMNAIYNMRAVLVALKKESGSWGAGVGNEVKKFVKDPSSASPATLGRLSGLTVDRFFAAVPPDDNQKQGVWLLASVGMGREGATFDGNWGGSTSVARLQQMIEEAVIPNA